MGSADDRRFEVLRAIVADFVATKEPIGSKTLVERHNLGVSSATVRNDMAVLEAEGYITQPHTSSGRVPTEKGYREFVDRLDDVKPMSSAERRAILGFLESGVDLDDVLRRAVRLLAQLTRQVAIIQYPTLSASTVRHLEVVALTPARLLLVVITDTGRVDQRVVELGDAIGEHELSQLRERLGVAEAPIEPGLRWLRCAPCDAETPLKLWRFMTPAVPLPLLVPTTSTSWPASKVASTVSSWPSV